MTTRTRPPDAVRKAYDRQPGTVSLPACTPGRARTTDSAVPTGSALTPSGPRARSAAGTVAPARTASSASVEHPRARGCRTSTVVIRPAVASGPAVPSGRDAGSWTASEKTTSTPLPGTCTTVTAGPVAPKGRLMVVRAPGRAAASARGDPSVGPSHVRSPARTAVVGSQRVSTTEDTRPSTSQTDMSYSSTVPSA